MDKILKRNRYILFRNNIVDLSITIILEIILGVIVYLTLHNINIFITIKNILKADGIILAFMYIKNCIEYFVCKRVNICTYKNFKIHDKKKLVNELNNMHILRGKYCYLDNVFVFTVRDMVVIAKYNDILSTHIVNTSLNKKDNSVDGVLRIGIKSGRFIKLIIKVNMMYRLKKGEIKNVIFKLKNINPNIKTL